MTASERLTQALAPLWGLHGTQLDELADRARVPRKIARMAARGRAVSVNHHLRLAVAVGLDSYFEGRTVTPFRIGSFHKRRFGEFVKLYRTERALSVRECAKAFGVSARALCWIETGHDSSIDVVLTVCRAIGIHPFLFCRDAFTAARSESIENREAA